jgi:hypothetical protein
MTRFLRLLAFCPTSVFVLGTSLLTTGLVCGQAPPKSATRLSTIATPELRVFRLKNLAAVNIIETVQRAVPEVQFFEESESNVIIGYGETKYFATAEALIKSLEEARAQNQGDIEEIEVLPLKHLDVSTCQHIVNAFQKSFGGTVSIDPEGNRLIVYGPVSTITNYMKLIKMLDDNAPPGSVRIQPKPAQVSVRVVWLLGGLDDPNASNPPEDLKKGALAELKSIGVPTESLRMLAQAVVNNAGMGKPFSMSTSVLLEGRCELTVRGTLIRGPEGPPRLDLAVRAERGAKTADGSPKQRLCEFETEIAAALGHYVVLGTSPMEDYTSVFVVQVNQKD